MKLQGVEQKESYLAVDISGKTSRFHYFWLRDNCPGDRSPNGQKLRETNLLDPEVQPSSVDHSDEAMTIEWSDGTQSVYPVSFLASWLYDTANADAKRYLCTATPAYRDKLSPASITTLEVQGGPMNEEEMAAFREKSGYRLALKVRVYDDLGKEPQMERPELDYYVPKLKACINR